MRTTCRLELLRRACVAVAILVAAPGAGAADAGTWDLGVAVAAVPASRGEGVRDAPEKRVPGVGAWGTFHASGLLALEAGVDAYFPQAELGRLGAAPRRKVLVAAGLRLGRRFGAVGVAARVRPGVLWSDYDLVTFPAARTRESDLAVDLGGVLEYRPVGRWLLRLDVSDLYVPSGDRESHPFDEHNLRLGIGVGLTLR